MSIHRVNFSPDLVGVLDDGDVPADVLWARLRNARDQLLLATDWTQVPDATVDQDRWALYRAALRDLPARTKDPLNVKWPEPPL